MNIIVNTTSGSFKVSANQDPRRWRICLKQSWEIHLNGPGIIRCKYREKHQVTTILRDNSTYFPEIHSWPTNSNSCVQAVPCDLLINNCKCVSFKTCIHWKNLLAHLIWYNPIIGKGMYPKISIKQAIKVIRGFSRACHIWSSLILEYDHVSTFSYQNHILQNILLHNRFPSTEIAT